MSSGWRSNRRRPEPTAPASASGIAGILAGLTALAKLNGLLILVSVLVYLGIRPEMRGWLRKPWPYVGALLAIAITLPFFHWNHVHGNIFLEHANAMKSRGHTGAFTPRWVGEFLGSQAIVLSPGVLIVYLVTLRVYRRTSAFVTDGRQFLWALTITPFAVTLLVALRTRVEANWAAAAYITGLILVADWLVNHWRAQKLRSAVVASVALALIISGMAIFYPAYPKPLWKRTNDLYGWKELARQVQREESGMGQCFVGGLNYRMASELAFYLPAHPTTYCLFLRSRYNEYMFWDDPDARIGQNAVIVNDLADEKADEKAQALAALRAVFGRVDAAPELKLYRAPYRAPMRVIQIYRCYGFKGYNPAVWHNGY